MPSSYFVRVDSSTANNPALNLTGTPSFEIEFVAETPSGALGDMFLDGGVDPDTQVVIGGQTYSFTVNWIGTLPTTSSQGSGQVPAEYRGAYVIRIAVQDYPTAGSVTYLSFMPYEDATAAEMDAFGGGRIGVQRMDTTPDPIPVCFASGTRIETPSGMVEVERLRIGDFLQTHDCGPLPVLWIGCTDHAWPGTDDRLRPIRIPSGSWRAGEPLRDLVVSPQHRILLAAEQCRETGGQQEWLVPAVGLVGYRGIHQHIACRSVRYYHVLLERHAILRAEGMLTESFYPGPMALRMMSLRQRLAILSLFPALRSDPEGGYGPHCRTVLTRRETEERLVATGGSRTTTGGSQHRAKRPVPFALDQ
jgi:hypothetical protein